MDFHDIPEEPLKSFGAGAGAEMPPSAAAAVEKEVAKKLTTFQKALKIGPTAVSAYGRALPAIVAGAGAMRALDKGEVGLSEFNDISGGLAAMVPGPGWALGAGQLAGGPIASVTGAAEPLAKGASQLSDMVDFPGVRNLFPSKFSSSEGTQMMPEAYPTPLSAPYLTQLLAERATGVKRPAVNVGSNLGSGTDMSGTIPGTWHQAPSVSDMMFPPNAPVNMKAPQRGTGYIKNNDTGETTVIDAREQLGIGPRSAAARAKAEAETAARMRFGPIIAAFGNPELMGKLVDAKEKRKEKLVDAQVTTANAAMTKATADRTASDVEVKALPNPTNPLQQDLYSINKRTNTMTKLSAPKVKPTFDSAQLEMAAAKFVPVGAPVTHAARTKAVAALRDAGYDTTGYE